MDRLPLDGLLLLIQQALILINGLLLTSWSFLVYSLFVLFWDLLVALTLYGPLQIHPSYSQLLGLGCPDLYTPLCQINASNWLLLGILVSLLLFAQKGSGLYLAHYSLI
jgi:hypothetical protein